LEGVGHCNVGFVGKKSKDFVTGDAASSDADDALFVEERKPDKTHSEESTRDLTADHNAEHRGVFLPVLVRDVNSKSDSRIVMGASDGTTNEQQREKHEGDTELAEVLALLQVDSVQKKTCSKRLVHKDDCFVVLSSSDFHIRYFLS
jgi:hypothetical protein